MSKKLAGKIAIVTGASKGIGASIARHLAAEGAAVVVNYASSKDDAERVVSEIASKGGRAIAVQANLGHPSDIERLFAETARAFGRLDILVNAINPGVVETEGARAGGFIEGDFLKEIQPRIPLGRIGQPQDIAPAVVFLASDDAAWMTGETLLISGGMR